MNKAKLKSYAPQARKDFIAAVEARAHSLGLSEMGGSLDIAPSEKKGDVTLIAGQAWPAKVHDQRQRLIKRMKKDGFAQTVEAVAYTWFNRFAALRYMEIHDYLDHGYRVLSSREGGLPEIIAHATDVAGSLPGLNAAQISDMKLAGNQDGELYRLLLVAQCNALSKAMPFLFEHIDDESELLLPGNLERTDSVVAKLVESIAEEDWSEVEVIGWLYQFYISEKKDAVIGKVVKSEDIPAATQLFTPNWIVQYLVQNSVGRLWLMANPSSTLKSDWKYYIEPAEQTPEVQAQLDALIQTRMAEDGGSLNPETITVLDPACGSGHILVEAYEVLKAIYLERGYQARAIPRLILEKNLFGLDIDDRAAQMAGFALMMKARADDRRLLESPIKLNVLSLQESKGLELDEFDSHLKPFGISRALLASLIDTFAHAKTFGSLIQIPEALEKGLPTLADGMGKAMQSGDVFAQAAAQDLLPLVGQAAMLAMKFDAVVANPPYMGGKYLTPLLKSFLKGSYNGYEKDLFSAFMIRNLQLAKESGQLGFMSPFVWMFISSYEELRHHFIENATLTSLIQLEYSGFDGATVPICTFTLGKAHFSDFTGSYIRLSDFRGSGQQGPKTLEAIRNPRCGWFYTAKPDDFRRIPGSPVAYWVSDQMRRIFSTSKSLRQSFNPMRGVETGNNERFLKAWVEVDFGSIGIGFNTSPSPNGKKWFPYNKGGEFAKWYSRPWLVIDWEKDGERIKNQSYPLGSRLPWRAANSEKYFHTGITWGGLTSTNVSFRYSDYGAVFDSNKGAMMFPLQDEIRIVLGFLNCKIASHLLKVLNPTLSTQNDDIGNLPYDLSYFESVRHRIDDAVNTCIEISSDGQNLDETSFGFAGINWFRSVDAPVTIRKNYDTWVSKNQVMRGKLESAENEINRLFIEAYDLQDELSPEVPEDQITLARADRDKDCRRLISYAIGCMMGRYSLDEPGLIYARAGNVCFDVTHYKVYPADADGIVPITDELWFEDDATNRVREFLNTGCGAETLEENMDWLAESLGKKGTETPEEAIRRYLSGSFYKDHLQTYKKRPIYWHFSSGKQGAFQALVYLHRYHEGTLARMRAEYVVPLTGKLQSRIEMLEKDLDAASATAARTKIAKQIESLKKKHVELIAYDEKLRHYADMRIQLDLDDGVKVNYGKFGDLLAEVKAVTGGATDD
ncbi:MAG: BREX-1 system adenine-specific DNA-methyltransferase PglX [Azonexus sp.]|nr:BREX-1 system adenine-specific DNA-methyltransferase PglX [Azonexus sp.]